MKTTECHNLSESLTAYLDGELKGAELQEFETALQESQALRDDVQSHQTARRIVDETLQPMAMPIGLWDGIRGEIAGGFAEPSRTSAQPSPSRTWTWRWAPVAAVTIVVLLLVVFPMFQGSPVSQIEKDYQQFVQDRQEQETERELSRPTRPNWTELEDNPFRRTSFDDLNDNPFAGE